MTIPLVNEEDKKKHQTSTNPSSVDHHGKNNNDDDDDDDRSSSTTRTTIGRSPNRQALGCLDNERSGSVTIEHSSSSWMKDTSNNHRWSVDDISSTAVFSTTCS